MVLSMTGYGKAEAQLPEGKLTVEIRTLNGKSADISLKSQLLPKDKEILVRKKLADKLQRGTIDVFLSFTPSADHAARPLNMDLVRYYQEQLGHDPETGVQFTSKERAVLLSAILRFPDVLEGTRGSQELLGETSWPLVEKAIDSAVDAVVRYRRDEGVILRRDVSSRVETILDLYREVESLEHERTQAVRERLSKALADLRLSPDPARFEQEMIFYLEKYDINEEKVRLRQHCKYFMETLEGDEYPGKKLGFIIQEMGREINTTGSKANHAGIQRLVVRMKDELEKIREQSMNIL